MIGAGIFALTGQIAELAGGWFPLVFLGSAVVAGFGAYSYVKLSDDDPSAGGIAMYLTRAYGKAGAGGVVAAGMSLLMYGSMVINESLVARTFGQYVMQLFAGPDQAKGGEAVGGAWAVPALAVGLLVVAFGVNVAANQLIDRVQLVMAAVKILGIAAFAGAGLWVSGLAWDSFAGGAGAGGEGESAGVVGIVASLALGLLAYKGFTTITNSGGELAEPKKNVGRAIVISLVICVVVYALVALAVGGSLSVPEIVASKDYALAEAARPAFGKWGLWLTVALAIVACASGVIASVFAVSRMLAMLVDMDLVPYKDVGIPGRRQYTTLTFTIVLASLLAVLFDLSRIASLGAIFYVVMDMSVHWGVLRYLRKQINARAAVLLVALALDALVLVGFLWSKGRSDPLILAYAGGGLLLVFGGEWLYLSRRAEGEAKE